MKLTDHHLVRYMRADKHYFKLLGFLTELIEFADGDILNPPGPSFDVKIKALADAMGQTKSSIKSLLNRLTEYGILIESDTFYRIAILASVAGQDGSNLGLIPKVTPFISSSDHGGDKPSQLAPHDSFFNHLKFNQSDSLELNDTHKELCLEYAKKMEKLDENESKTNEILTEIEQKLDNFEQKIVKNNEKLNELSEMLSNSQSTGGKKNEATISRKNSSNKISLDLDKNSLRAKNVPKVKQIDEKSVEIRKKVSELFGDAYKTGSGVAYSHTSGEQIALLKLIKDLVKSTDHDSAFDALDRAIKNSFEKYKLKIFPFANSPPTIGAIIKHINTLQAKEMGNGNLPTSEEFGRRFGIERR